MRSQIVRQIVAAIEADVRSRPSAMEFEMAYQARVAIDRIKFAIKHAEQFAVPCDAMREAGLQLLDALERLEARTAAFRYGPVWPAGTEMAGSDQTAVE